VLQCCNGLLDIIYYYWNLHFINNVINIKTEVLLLSLGCHPSDVNHIDIELVLMTNRRFDKYTHRIKNTKQELAQQEITITCSDCYVQLKSIHKIHSLNGQQNLWNPWPEKKVQEYIIQYTLKLFIYTMHERTLVKTKMSNVFIIFISVCTRPQQ
jgi:hypothetical protein